jgi:heavy metal sensor kinase
MFRFYKSIRVILTGWYTLILLTTLIAFGIFSYTYTRQKLSENLDLSLGNEVRWVKTFIEPKASKVKPSRRFTLRKNVKPSQSSIAAVEKDSAEIAAADNEIWSQIYEHALLNPRKTMIEVADKNGTVIFRSFTVGEESLMIAEAPINEILMSTVKNEQGEDLRVASTSTSNTRIYAAYPLAELRDVIENLFSIFLILVPIALLVSVVGGWFLAYISLKPVDDVTKRVQQITAHNLDQKIPPRGVNDEIGRLISTFNSMIERLRSSFEQVRQFSVDASHELRTPLTIMRGEVELTLQNPRTEAEYRRILVSNLEEIIRLSTIVENLLILTKAEMGNHEVAYTEKVDLQDLFQGLYEDGEIIAEKKRINIELVKNEPAIVLGDSVRLRQLMLNLLDNAIKYTPEEGKVSLLLESQNGYAKLSVQDNGMGIPKEEQGKIFDRFYRIDKARSRDLGGTGLGLSIAKLIVEQHRGRIEVESELHHGSTFSVYLPLLPSKPADTVG